MPYLSESQVTDFHRNGFLLIEGFFSGETVEKLKKKMTDIIQSNDLSKVDTVFSTHDQKRQSNDYFMNSGGDIRFFWEEKARDADGKFIAPVEKAINKVGHALHDLDPDFQSVSYDPRVGSICEELGMTNPLLVQSMYIFKQPKIGGEVVPHQDGAFLYTEPQSCLGLWWPLHNCTKDNGCLWAVPGSHKEGVTRRFRRKDPPADGTEFVPPEPVVWDISTAVPLLIPAGTLVILHNALVHFSKENLSENARHAYSIHIVEGKEGFSYPADNWLQRPVGFPFREITQRVQ